MHARRKHAFSAGGSGGIQDGSSTSLSVILKQARKSGQLNLSNRSLGEVPSAVWRINIDTPEEGKSLVMDNSDDRWWEQVDLTKLILASNGISQLSDDIRLLAALVVLDIHDNHLSRLPDAIGELQCLQRLHANHNILEALPQSLFTLVHLQTLHLQNNRLSSLPNDIGYLDRLEDLDLSNNQLSSLPVAIGHLTKLTKFTIVGNSLQTLPHEIGLMRSLKILEATHNQIHTLPDELGDLRHLECLYLRHNKLTHLPQLESCTALKELHVGNNALRGISVENLHNLTSLMVLDLRDNRLDKLPDEVGLLQALERLDITNNNLSILPFALGTLPNLKAIVLDGNPLKSIRRDIVMRGTNELKKYLRSRVEPPEAPAQAPPPVVFQETSGTSGVIGGNGDGIDRFRMATTKTLEYCDKKVSILPEELLSAAASSGVTVVNLNRNLLTSFPSGLVELQKSLSELSLSFNRLSTLDSCVGLLERLVMLDLSNNQLSNLPDEVGSLHLLREIVISFNRFTSLPAPVYRLKRLEILMANDNQIHDLDAEALCRLEMLATLSLQNNDLVTIPPQLGNCTQLRNIQLEGNPFRQPRPAILAKGTLAILEYLRGRIPAS